jgi:predicted O-methyltransferase YrrM
MSILSKIGKAIPQKSAFPMLEKNVLEVRSLEHLKKALDWKQDPIITDEDVHKFHFLEDLNDRRLRDAEVLLGACRNRNGEIILEIGTFRGRTTAAISENAPNSKIYTVNILPEDIEGGGEAITAALPKEEIGEYYREKGCQNIQQIYANTATWEPGFGPIAVAFIDGCHDSEFVINDTIKVLRRCEPGSLILWHDFNPLLTSCYSWISSVCGGIEELYRKGVLKGKILHLQDSWIGLYRVP